MAVDLPDGRGGVGFDDLRYDATLGQVLIPAGRTGNVDPAVLERALPDLVRCTPRAIRERLGLNAPIYARTAAYGHFGRTPDNNGGFGWERTDLVSELKSLA